MAPKQAGIVWYRGRWQYFTEYSEEYLGDYKDDAGSVSEVEMRDVKMHKGWKGVPSKHIKRYPEGGDHAQR